MTDSKPDLAAGVRADRIADRPLAGTYDGKPVIIGRVNGRPCAVSGECTHLGAPLETGLMIDGEIRCPWHHARFSLVTGEAVGAPAIEPLSCYVVEEQDGLVRVIGQATPKPVRVGKTSIPPVVIIGGGGAGYACAEMLARGGHGEQVTILDADPDAPYDRTFCSKHYLAGEKSRGECAMPMPEWNHGKGPRIRTGIEVASIDVTAHKVVTVQGEQISYGTLVLATGAEPLMPEFDGSHHPAVHLLRTLADADALIEAAQTAQSVVILGAGFVGLEVAASLVARKPNVTVVAQDEVPLASVIGEEASRFVQSMHEEKGVAFRLGRKIAAFDGRNVTLDDGSLIQADMLVVGAGVKPRVALTEAAGIELAEKGGGIKVDGFLAASAPNVYAIGDIASYPDPRLEHPLRVEHWVHAQRQGQYLARRLMAQEDAMFGDTPFFWSTHYDVGIHYVGHAAGPTVSRIEGSVQDGEFAIFFSENSKECALVTLERDIQSLEIEAEWDAYRGSNV
jgi:NADPH-dependent 2,4-dienoyl-CoA reductase/sulfur reductase-like enzyme/nitrite reductase/ring-hydroxylating ferredoxin subunit